MRRCTVCRVLVISCLISSIRRSIASGVMVGLCVDEAPVWEGVTYTLEATRRKAKRHLHTPLPKAVRAEEGEFVDWELS